jgi:primosomal protein N'
VRQQAAISPFQQPAAAASMQTRFPEAFWDTFAPTTPKQELTEWLKVRTGKTQLVFGREGAIFAPYLNLRHAILAEAEDPSYYHGHLPYLPLQHAVTSLTQLTGADLVVRSNLPPATGELLWGKPVVSMVKDRQVTLVDLRKDPLINPSLVSAIQGALRQNRRIILLLNSYDKQVKGTDGMTNLIPGVQTLKKQLASALGLPTLPDDVILGTRSILSETYRDVGLTVALNLDTQLNPQCFADELSLWSDLGSLFSYPAPCIIQARSQDSQVLHALRNQQFSSYTRKVVSERITSGLPPAPNITFCTLPTTPTAATEMATLREKLLPLLTPTDWQVSESFERSFRKITSSHLALIPPPNALQLPTSATKLLAELKRPWKVQVGAWHIL